MHHPAGAGARAGGRAPYYLIRLNEHRAAEDDKQQPRT
jgi:hypothetical protein